MELKSLNTRDPAEEGAFLHLRHPVLRHLMYEGENVDETGGWDGEGEEPTKVGVFVKGSEAPSLKKYLLMSRKMAMKARKKEVDTEEESMKFLCKVVIKFQGITRNGVPLDADDEGDVRMFFEQSSNLIEQVTEFSAESQNFFKPAKSD